MSDGGKGDKRRPTDEEKYQSNYDNIFRKPTQPCPAFHRCSCLTNKCEKGLDNSTESCYNSSVPTSTQHE